MKLVIRTQYRENYGDADQPYWKFKGGNTYVIEGLTQAQLTKAVKAGIPTIKSLIEYSTPMCEEYILSMFGHEDNSQVCDDWEQPVQLSYKNKKWVAREVEENGMGSFLPREIARVVHTWDLLPEGKRENYTTVYTMVNGEEHDNETVRQAIEKLKQAAK